MWDVIQAVVRYVVLQTDVFGFVSGYSQYTPANSAKHFEFVETSLETVAVYNYYGTNATRRAFLYVVDPTRNDVCHQCEVVLLYISGGGFVESGAQNVPYSLMTYSRALQVPIVSVKYPLNNGAELSVQEVHEALDTAVSFTRGLFPTARFLLVGSSSGAALAIGAVMRRPEAYAALWLESPLTCVDSLAEDILSDETSCLYDSNRVSDPDFPYTSYRGEGLCFDNRTAFPLPTIVTYSKRDRIIPIAQPERLIGTPNVTVCSDRFSIHGATPSLSGGCLSEVDGWMEDNSGLVMDRNAVSTNFLLTEPILIKQYMSSFLWKKTFCRQVCQSQTRNPILFHAYECALDNDVFT